MQTCQQILKNRTRRHCDEPATRLLIIDDGETTSGSHEFYCDEHAEQQRNFCLNLGIDIFEDKPLIALDLNKIDEARAWADQIRADLAGPDDDGDNRPPPLTDKDDTDHDRSKAGVLRDGVFQSRWGAVNLSFHEDGTIIATADRADFEDVRAMYLVLVDLFGHARVAEMPQADGALDIWRAEVLPAGVDAADLAAYAQAWDEDARVAGNPAVYTPAQFSQENAA